jgi:hypothetical protein
MRSIPLQQFCEIHLVYEGFVLSFVSSTVCPLSHRLRSAHSGFREFSILPGALTSTGRRIGLQLVSDARSLSGSTARSAKVPEHGFQWHKLGKKFSSKSNSSADRDFLAQWALVRVNCRISIHLRIRNHTPAAGAAPSSKPSANNFQFLLFNHEAISVFVPQSISY